MLLRDRGGLGGDICWELATFPSFMYRFQGEGIIKYPVRSHAPVYSITGEP